MPARPAKTNTASTLPSFSRAVYSPVGLSVICASNYKEYLAYKFFDEVFSLLNNEDNLAILDKDYVKDKYLNSIKNIIARYDNTSEVDKLSLAIEKSEQVKKNAEENVKKLLDKGDQIEVNSIGTRGVI